MFSISQDDQNILKWKYRSGGMRRLGKIEVRKKLKKSVSVSELDVGEIMETQVTRIVLSKGIVLVYLNICI